MKTIKRKIKRTPEQTNHKILPKSPSFENDLTETEVTFVKERTDTFTPLEVNTDDLLEYWEDSSKEFKKRISRILGKLYGLTDALATVQSDIRNSKIDPAAEILDKDLLTAIEKIISIRLQHEIIDFLYDSSSDTMKTQAEFLFKNILENNKTQQNNPLKDLLSKFTPKEAEGSPFSDPTSNVGIKVSMKDSK